MKNDKAETFSCMIGSAHLLRSVPALQPFGVVLAWSHHPFMWIGSAFSEELRLILRALIVATRIGKKEN